MNDFQFNLNRKIVLILSVVVLCFTSCKEKTITITSSGILVENKEALYKALKDLEAGDVVTLKNGVWKDVQIKLRGKGTASNPIVLKAETPGKVTIEGESYIKFGGEYLVVEGLHFKNGFSPSSAVIDFRITSKEKPSEIANNCKFTNCVIEDFNQPKRDKSDLWVNFWGRHNELSNCYIAGKTNRGQALPGAASKSEQSSGSGRR